MIVTLTVNPSLDVATAAERVVHTRKLRCDQPRREPGGGGINVARAVRNLGGHALALYPAGGPNGRMLQDLVERDDLDHRPIPIAGHTRANVTVLDRSNGDQFRFVMPGPELSEDEQSRCLAEIEKLDPPPDFLVASGSLPPGVPDDFYRRVAEIGQRLGTRVVIDTSGPALRNVARSGVYLLKPNLRELAELTGRELRSEADQNDAARALVRDGFAEVALVSLGAGGVLLATDETTTRRRAPTVRIRSRVGAGDSMVAGVVLALDRGESIAQAACWGVAAGTAAVMTPGTELCRREDAERLFEQMQCERS